MAIVVVYIRHRPHVRVGNVLDSIPTQMQLVLSLGKNFHWTQNLSIKSFRYF